MEDYKRGRERTQRRREGKVNEEEINGVWEERKQKMRMRGAASSYNTIQ